jgi:hypothetical protein
VRAGEQLAGGADGVDRVALARPALAHVPGAVDLGDLLPFARQVPGQAQPVVAGSFHRPYRARAGGGRVRPVQHLRVAGHRGRHLQLRHRPAAGIADRGSMGVQVGTDSYDQVSLIGSAHRFLLECDAGISAPAWRETPAAIL